MFLKRKDNDNMIEIIDVETLADPALPSVMGRQHAGEEMQDEESFEKAELEFPSGESLPRCWLDLHWREG
ncbi:acetyltransferase [Guyparkeria hydrothermalis]|uniref:acetyltransferase n=1 Tax=Guyparkeria hydrothermalis TaxID=923 RepID=UPI00201FBFDA|nr:acetyltransferase [Guyparkeria hydrothermalis]MCL7744613.1 acetyltransferase [Guyparkeria hydrothermalis]